MTLQKLRLAFVVPRFGSNVVGGAELLASRIAERLAEAGHYVEIVTTTAIDHYTWANELNPGTEEFGTLTVKRFEAAARDIGVHSELERAIADGLPLGSEEQELWLRNGVSSPSMEAYLAQADLDAMFPMPYLFGTTYFAYKSRPEIAIPIPCLHDEPYAYLPFVKDLLTGSLGLMFNSRPEAALARRIAPRLSRWEVVGMGFDPPAPGDTANFRSKHGLSSSFILYVGRREHGKNTPKLIDYFLRYKARNPSDLQLVLVGSGDVAVPNRPDVRTLEVDWADADAMYRAAEVFVQPSVNESFSIVLMQAWLAERPALVHGRCAVTSDYCRRANAGLWFENYAEFEETVSRLLADEHLRSQLGRAGRSFVLDELSWDAVLGRFHGSIFDWLGSRTTTNAGH